MKIAIDCRMIGSGGIGSYLTALLPFFISRHECIIFGKKEYLEKFKDQSKIIDCDIPTFSLNEMIFFPKEILKHINQCDVYYTPYCNIPNGINIPIFSTIHDVVFLDIIGLSGKVGTLLRKLIYQHCINKSKCIFTVSEFSKKRIIHHLKVRKTPVVVTYNAVPYWFSNGINNVQKAENILFVGNIKKHKGLHTLLDAYKICLSKGFKGKLKIVGNADNFRTKDTTIASRIQELDEHVEFTGRISDEELKMFYAQAKLLVQPSLYEGFGMPPMEALSLGTNVVISDIPVFKEIYKDLPVTYFEVENADDLADKIKSAYNQNVPDFSNPYSFEKTFNIINDMLEQIQHN